MRIVITKIIVAGVISLSFLFLQEYALPIKGINILPFVANEEIATCYDRGVPLSYFKHYQYIIGEFNPCFNVIAGNVTYIPLIINFLIYFGLIYVVIHYSFQTKYRWYIISLFGVILIYLIGKYWIVFRMVNYY